jgi:hypothetical protein
MTSNIFEAILGPRDKPKWDAFFRLLEWLLDDEQGHGLHCAIAEAFCKHVFGETGRCDLRREQAISLREDGRGDFIDLAVGIPGSRRMDFALVERDWEVG